MAFMNLVMGGNPNIGMGAGGMGGGAGTQAQQPRRPPPGSIQVTPQELEAIKRLQALGFSQHRALEAYLSCDKNEEYAANFLFESMIEEDNTMLEA
jgi:UV excision repair protein RAD23